VGDFRLTWGHFPMFWKTAAAGVVMLGFLASAAIAQTPDAAKPVAKPLAKAPSAAAAAVGAAGSSETGLKGRVESLEEQLVDMQVVVGTLESMSKSGGGSGGAAFRASSSGGADASRVEALEGQVRSLSTQVQQLSDQVRSMGGVPRRSDAAVSASPVQSATAAPGFGSTTVKPGGDAIGGLIDGAPPPAAAGNLPPVATESSTAGLPPPVTTAALPPAGDGSDPKQLYETAYGYLLQRDYGAAEVAFDDFLKKFPSDSLAGNAQYWLGESHFVRGQYKAAAGAFLKGYQSYAASAKAPDSLLKLAMSLDRLGQKDAACSSFAELNTKFPNAGQSVKSRAQSERQRVGCP
jgi:tol-pal system protein YbgF